MGASTLSTRNCVGPLSSPLSRPVDRFIGLAFCQGIGTGRSAGSAMTARPGGSASARSGPWAASRCWIPSSAPCAKVGCIGTAVSAALVCPMMFWSGKPVSSVGPLPRSASAVAREAGRETRSQLPAVGERGGSTMTSAVATGSDIPVALSSSSENGTAVPMASCSSTLERRREPAGLTGAARMSCAGLCMRSPTSADLAPLSPDDGYRLFTANPHSQENSTELRVR